jgi:hypothetical protein
MRLFVLSVATFLVPLGCKRKSPDEVHGRGP